MRKFFKWLVAGIAALFVILAIALPAVLPPLAEHFVVSTLADVGIPALARMRLDYAWRNGPGLTGDLEIVIRDAPWRIRATFGASCSEWAVRVKMDETAFSETDPTIATLLARHPLTAVSNLTFSGTVALDARAERTFRKPVPAWSVRLPIRNLNAGLTVDESTYALKAFSATPAASGLADHFDVAPLFLRARAIHVDGFALTNFTASVLTSDKSMTVSEASADFCGGKIGVYALRLNPKNLNAGFTLFLDDIDAGTALSHLNGFRGSASGKLHGKMRLFVKEGGKALRIRDSFLYSTPGEGGKIRLEDATPVTDNLAMAGIDEAARANVANALGDLDYSVLKLNLLRRQNKAATLSIVLRGTATRGQASVPVDLTLNFNGELEQLVNTALGYSAKMKGQKP